MLKYVYTKVVFAEIPDEITLAINISNCPCHCKGCHSPYLSKDVGTELTFEELLQLYTYHKGITCISFMGGDIEPSYINKMASILREGELPIKIAWYSGRQELAKEIDLKNFDYIKLGPYIEELGPLNNPNTNQRLYEVSKLSDQVTLKDITYKFWKK